MENNSDRDVAASSMVSDQANALNSSAQNLFGRGFRQIAWPMLVFLFAGRVLVDVVGILAYMWSHSGKMSPILSMMEMEIWPNLAASVACAVGLCWLLANVRHLAWLFLSIIALSMLDGGAWMITSHICYMIRDLWRGYSSSFSFERDWRSLVVQVASGVVLAVVVLVSLRLRRQFYVLIPIISAGLDCILRGVWRFLWHAINEDRWYFLQAAIAGAVFGACLWIGIEFQRRKPIICERLTDARLSQGAYIFLVACGHLLGWNLLLSAMGMRGNEITTDILGWLAILIMLAASIVFLVFLYRAWVSIQTPFSISAGSVIWKLFIPFYNIYWIFQAIPGFATEYQNFVNYHELKLPKVRRGWLIAYAVITLILPLVGRLLPIREAAPFVFGVFIVIVPVAEAVTISHIAGAVNRLPLNLPYARDRAFTIV
jgi:hypothetical protein